MRYIVTQRFRAKAICGPVNLPYGTVCDTEGDFITRDGKQLCAITSQNAYDHFSRDDDGTRAAGKGDSADTGPQGCPVSGTLGPAVGRRGRKPAAAGGT